MVFVEAGYFVSFFHVWVGAFDIPEHHAGLVGGQR